METNRPLRLAGNESRPHSGPSGQDGRRGRRLLGHTGGDRESPLTPRETEILRYLARGLTVCEIARELHRSPKTVESHKTSMMRKLRIHNRVGLIWYAIRTGVVSAEG